MQKFMPAACCSWLSPRIDAFEASTGIRAGSAIPSPLSPFFEREVRKAPKERERRTNAKRFCKPQRRRVESTQAILAAEAQQHAMPPLSCDLFLVILKLQSQVKSKHGCILQATPLMRLLDASSRFPFRSVFLGSQLGARWRGSSRVDFRCARAKLESERTGNLILGLALSGKSNA